VSLLIFTQHSLNPMTANGDAACRLFDRGKNDKGRNELLPGAVLELRLAQGKMTNL